MRTLTHYMGCRNLLSSSRAVLAAEEFESREYQITSSLTLSIASLAGFLPLGGAPRADQI